MSVLDKLRTRKAQPPSLDQQIDDVRGAYRATLSGLERDRSWVSEVYPDHVIVCADGDYYSVPYSTTADGYEFDADAATEVERTWVPKSFDRVDIEKTDDERQVVFGWAYVSERSGERVVDHSGEWIEKTDLEDAAYAFNLVSREGDEAHTEEVKAHLVESFVATDEKLTKWATGDDGNVDDAALAVLRKVVPTAWWVGFYIPDAELFGKVKDGTYPALSIGGRARREEVA